MDDLSNKRKSSKYEVVIGLEVHAELATNSKIYCSCTTKFGSAPNTQCCPVCLGMPGALPVLNKRAVEYAVIAGLATNCSISQYSKQDRKNYFYPDLPKAYQTTQFDQPLCTDGYLEIEVNGRAKKVGISRIHIEEDAGKLIHDESGNSTSIDYNRCGVPLIEIVTCPELNSASEVKAFIEKLKAILEYNGVSDCKMQEGSLRVDVNLSVRKKGEKALGTRTEMKNLNSIKAIVRAVEYEEKRQIEELEKGRKIIQQTRRWDDSKGENYLLRDKEEAFDYMYLFEPDLCPIVIDEVWLEEIKSSIPELPDERKKRIIAEYKIPEYDASFITGSKLLADYFEKAARKSSNPKAVSNWIMGDVMKKLKDNNLEIPDIPISPEYIAELVELVDSNIISSRIARQVFEIMWDTNKQPYEIVKEKRLQVISNTEEIRKFVIKVLDNNARAIEDIKKGKGKSFDFLVGQVMRATNGKAQPQIVNKLLAEELSRLMQ